MIRTFITTGDASIRTRIVQGNGERILLVLHHMVSDLAVPPVWMLVVRMPWLKFHFVIRLSGCARDSHIRLDTVDEFRTHHGLTERQCLLSNICPEVRQPCRRFVMGAGLAESTEARGSQQLYLHMSRL
jgi:hypothetical protein